jgi:hypothetical protein
VKLRLAIDADSAVEARAIAEEVWRKMEVTAGAEPQITRSAGRAPHWNVITDLDLSALESITPDDAVTRFRNVIRNLPGVAFAGGETGDRRSGLWQWLPDSWELDWQNQELAHPAVRAAGIAVVVVTKKTDTPDLQVRISADRLPSREPWMLTTKPDHDNIRLRSMPDDRKRDSQMSNGSRHDAGSLRARDRCQPFLDGTLACADRPVQQRGTATHTRYGRPEQSPADALCCAVRPRAGTRR